MPGHRPRGLSFPLARAGYLAAVLLSLAPAAAKADPCGLAIERAARLTGVPGSLLRAVAEVESGVQLPGGKYAWPWAVNDGRSLLFRNRAAATEHVETLIAAGNFNVDIGCMQINWRWHGHEISSPAALFDPEVNVLYAARYLAALRREFDTWAEAVSAYHSRREIHAGAYRCRIARRLKPDLRPSDCN